MKENNGNIVPKEEPNGNFIISLKDIESFNGNITLNSVEAIVDDAFKGARTVSIEGQEKKYLKEERQALLNEIHKLQKKGEQK